MNSARASISIRSCPRTPPSSCGSSAWKGVRLRGGLPITIIGAGPAGLTAAIVLRKHGFPVTVYEKSTEVGSRLSGDFQGIENWSSEEDVLGLIRRMGVAATFPSVPYYGGTVFAPGMRPVSVSSQRPIFYLVKRGPMPGTLDTALKEQALSLGAEVTFGRQVDSFPGRAIVGTGPCGVKAVAVGITFTTTARDTAAVVFGDDFAPKGYAYLLVNDGYGTMASVLYREHRRGNECFEKARDFLTRSMDLAVSGEKKFGSFGDFFIRDTHVHNGNLFVGESAGFQDCLWGFGMRYAMVSGWLAARSFIEGADYDVLWKRELRPMLETSLVNRYLFERFGSVGYRYLTRKFAGGDPCRYLGKHYAPSHGKHLLLPLARRAYRETGRTSQSSRPGK